MCNRHDVVKLLLVISLGNNIKVINMKKYTLTALALAAASLVSTQAFAQAKEGPWMVRVRAVSLSSANTDTTSLGLSVNDIVLPEVDISYFFSPNLAAELILTVPQEHNVSSTVLGGKIGTLSQLPPTLLVQYHFPMNGYKPYVGAGINYTKFTTSDIPLGGSQVTPDSSSWGGALQVGVDVPMSGNMYFNFDVKKVYIGTNINYLGSSVGSLRVDPLLVGVGIGWRF
jgi:outer membrane protein